MRRLLDSNRTKFMFTKVLDVCSSHVRWWIPRCINQENTHAWTHRMVIMESRACLLQNLFFKANLWMMDKVEINVWRGIDHIQLILLKRCLCPPYNGVNSPAGTMESKDDPKDPNELEKWEVSPTSTSTIHNANTKSHYKTLNASRRKILIPFIILFPM